jgi:hypothetical protein
MPGNSSKTTITTGIGSIPSIDFAEASPASVIFETGETNRKRIRKTSGAGLSTLRNERTGSARA